MEDVGENKNSLVSSQGSGAAMDAAGKRAYEERRFLGSHLVTVFELFRADLTSKGVDGSYYWLNAWRLVSSVDNAICDRDRSARFHSDTGASSIKTASFVARWLAHDHPVYVDRKCPINLPNSRSIVSANSAFAAYAIQSLTGRKMCPRLFRDLQYCFEYRSIRGEELNLLLDHTLGARLAPDVKTESDSQGGKLVS